MTYKIPISEALTLITDFILHPQLSAVAKGMGLGGTFTKSTFLQFTDDRSESLLLWYCFQRPVDESEQEKLLIALENHPVIIPDENPPKPSPLQIISSDHFLFDGQGTSAGVTDFFENQSIRVPIIDITINRILTRVWMYDFIEDFPPGRLNPFNNNTYAYINNTTNFEIQAFIKQSDEIAAVRYFFGFDDKAINKIKVIFVPVDAAGKNITRFADGSEPYYLDRAQP